jgi:predicted GNAT family acetyltransferase
VTGADTTIVDRPEASRYEAIVDGEVAGFLEYRRGDGRILLQHTEVGPTYEGRGIGSALARHGLDGARAAGLSIIVTCPFIKSWLAKHPDQADGVVIR